MWDRLSLADRVSSLTIGCVPDETGYKYDYPEDEHGEAERPNEYPDGFARCIEDATSRHERRTEDHPLELAHVVGVHVGDV